MRKMFVIIFILILSIGCSSSFRMSYSDSSATKNSIVTLLDFNKIATNRKAMVVLRNEALIYVKNISVVEDNVYWTNEETGIKETVKLKEVKEIILSNRWKGMFEGAGLGCLSGGLAGVVASLFVDPDAEMAGLAKVFYIIGGGAFGLVWGTAVGVGRGHWDLYYFENDEIRIDTTYAPVSSRSLFGIDNIPK